MYVGMKYATFCWHYEDLMLFSINYSHWGQPKLWYCVPEEDLEKFEKACKKKLAGLVRKDPNILHDMVTMISPAYLVQNGVSSLKIHYLLIGARLQNTVTSGGIRPNSPWLIPCWL